MPKFYNANHSLTDYALSCGYREVTFLHSGDLFDKIMLEKEHCIYYVRYIKGNLSDYACFERLTDARRAYRKAGGKYSAIAHSQYELAKARREWLDKNR